MNDSKISVRYAKALFELALEKEAVDIVRSDMKTILDLSANNEVKELLKSPVIENRIKRSALLALVKDHVGEISLTLLALTVDNNRESFIPGIARCYIDIADKYNGITKASLTTASEISKTVVNRIINLIENRFKTNVMMEVEINPGIIGGFMLKIEDQYLDASVRNQLRMIKKELTGDQ